MLGPEGWMHNDIPTTNVLLSTPHFTMLDAVLEHAFEKGLMAESIGVSYQCQVSPCSGDGHITAPDLLQKPTPTYR